MKNLKVTTGILTIAFVALSAMSCKDAKKESNEGDSHHTEMSADGDHSEMKHNNGDGHHDGDKKEMVMSGKQDGNSELVLNDYFNLKNALVGDANAKAKELGASMAQRLRNFNISAYTEAQKSELNDIIEDAVEHAEHISESEIAHQREHFKILSKDVTDMVAITGTKNKLYEQFCPMYDGGSAWLSMSDEVLNPYYGSKMLNCGKVQKEIN
ncbi:DUF3347 domain-containing protein [Arenibacter sp. TNZ]|jgi:hypothetical protein|uniref:DUF3347 domain-containing protein n=1 Tax=Arenibacter TaxID=178469 RepID=UPI000CD3AAF5|nr:MULTISPECIES: DUF3347 domain-containing protein [Arenibacter]MCM4170843.1 DUF3347 domain-containing protein [Arenibacter sp. TNZ]